MDESGAVARMEPMSKAGNPFTSLCTFLLALLIAFPAVADEPGEKKQGFFAKLFQKKEEEDVVTINDWRQRETLEDHLKDIRRRIADLEEAKEKAEDEDEEDDD